MGKRSVAMIGCGWVGEIYHLPGCAKLDTVEVVAVCDIDQGKAKAVGDKFGIREHYTNVETMLAKAKPDIAIVGVPCKLHKPLLELCLSHGCHVLVEKPLAPSLEDIDEMMEMARGAKTLVMVDQNYRFSKIALRVKEVIDSGRIGAPYWLEFHQQIWNARQLEETFLGGESRVTFFEMGIHLVDLARFWLGEEATQVHARMPELPHWDFPGDGFASVTVAFGDRITTHLILSWASRCNDQMRIGTAGRLEASEGTATFAYVNDLKVHSHLLGETFVPDDLDESDWPAGFMSRTMAHFVHCIETEKTPMTNLEDNRKSMAIVLAAYESAQRGQAVDPVGVGR